MTAFQLKEHLWAPIRVLNARIFVRATVRLQMCTCHNWEIAENKILMVTSVLHCSTCSIVQCTVRRLLSYAKPLVRGVVKNLSFSMWGGREWGEEGTEQRLVHAQSGFYGTTWGKQLAGPHLSSSVPSPLFSLVQRVSKDSPEVKSPKNIEPPSSSLEVVTFCYGVGSGGTSDRLGFLSLIYLHVVYINLHTSCIHVFLSFAY